MAKLKEEGEEGVGGAVSCAAGVWWCGAGEGALFDAEVGV
jgi:hypothetical protein